MASFKPPSIIYHNGQLTGYVIRHTRVGSSNTKYVTTKYTRTTISLSQLDEFANYSVTVAAVNVNGTGPFSDPVVQATGNMQATVIL